MLLHTTPHKTVVDGLLPGDKGRINVQRTPFTCMVPKRRCEFTGLGWTIASNIWRSSAASKIVWLGVGDDDVGLGPQGDASGANDDQEEAPTSFSLPHRRRKTRSLGTSHSNDNGVWKQQEMKY
jgi:hypothetical protein